MASKRYDPPSRVDKNQPQLVEKFRSLGASVVITSQVGHGYPDLNVCINSHTVLVECKSATGKLTKDQETFHASWSGIIWIARTEDDVEKIVKFYSDLTPLHAHENKSDHIDSPPIT